MTKYKQLLRTVQHLADYQMNGRVARRAAEYRAPTRDRENAVRRVGNEQIPDRQIPGIAPLHARPTLSPRWRQKARSVLPGPRL
jgi:hypothetical protein